MSNKQKVLFVVLFAVLGFIALQIPVAKLEGSKAAFTLFDLFAPIATGFLGTWLGVLAVAIMQVVNFLFHGAKVLDAGTIVRFFPMLFGAIYFAKFRRWNIAVPALAIIAFIAHPVGREVWYYSMFWLIPIAMAFFQERSLIARALGTTFAAHAVGGALWIWFVGLPATVWQSLIPIVIRERLIFAAGIAVMYLVFNNVLALVARKVPRLAPMVNQKYAFVSSSNSLY